MDTPATCRHCGASLSADDPMCLSCGTLLTGGGTSSPSSEFGSGVVERNAGKQPSVKKSARWLLYLSLLFAVMGTIQGMRSNSEAKEALQVLDSYEDAESVEVEGERYTVAALKAEIKREMWLIFGINYLLAGVMLGLFFWARTNPYHAMLLGLCIYVGLIGFAAYEDPSTLAKGIWLKVVIIVAMAAGIRAAYAERAQAARMPRATLA